MQTQNNKLPISRRLRLLIVNPGDRSFTKLQTLHGVYEIFYADNLDRGLLLAREYTPALVIVNSCPEEDEFRVQLKKCYRTSRIPVLAIIPKSEIKGQPASFIPGWDDFIKSPFEEF